MIKKILILLIFFIPLQAFGFEDYILLSDSKVDSAYSKDENIATVETFYTIDNNKKILILKAKSEGKTQIVIETNEKILTIDTEINETSTTLSNVEGISSFPVDMINKPTKPTLRGK